MNIWYIHSFKCKNIEVKDDPNLKEKVKDFWDEKSCGEVYASGQSIREYYESQSQAIFELTPYLADFAKYTEGQGKDVLEIGIGMGSDHTEWAKSDPKSLTGIDLTPRAIEHTKKRLELYGFSSNLKTADAENLPFEDESFDLVYSFGVLHHSPNTAKAVDEVFRVLRPGGAARIMIYQTKSLTGYMLWLRYGLLAGAPFKTLAEIYFNHLESPGTKCFSLDETKNMFSKFQSVEITNQFSQGDLLIGAVGQRHKGILLALAKKFWPRWFIKKLFKNHGLYHLIEARK
jgi:ubiquinone/menaquinone biosynthesis C-methylase UbiE